MFRSTSTLSPIQPVTQPTDWNDHDRDGKLPWDTGRPSSQLQRVLAAHAVRPGPVLALGCGTGVNSVWLAEQGVR